MAKRSPGDQEDADSEKGAKWLRGRRVSREGAGCEEGAEWLRGRRVARRTLMVRRMKSGQEGTVYLGERWLRGGL